MPDPSPALNELAFSVETECGCNERPVVLRALRDAARDFFIRSEAWVGNFSYNNEPEVDYYDAAGAQDAYVHRVLSVEFISRGIPQRLLNSDFELADQNLIRLKIAHKDENLMIRIRSVLIPNPGKDHLPQDLLVEYRDGLVYGACMRIVRQAGKPWFSPELEQMFNLNYLREVTKAITRSENL